MPDLKQILRELPLQIEQVREKFSIPAFSAAVVYQGEVVFAEGQGTRTFGKNEKVDEHSTYALASISKSTAAACLSILVDEGKLAWDDPVRKYLPDFKLMDQFATREIRIRDLLIHNSGLPSESGGTIWYGSDFSREEVLARLQYLRPQVGFRSRYAYQNITFLVAGELIAAVSGLSWDDFVRERIFAPLGMRRTVTSMAALQQMDNVTSPHIFKDEGVMVLPYRSHDNIGPAAAVSSSVMDWAKYLILHLNGGVYAGQQILSPQRIDELWSARMPIPISVDKRLPDVYTPNFYAYGMGWYLQDYRGQKMVHHSGGVDGMRTFSAMLPAKQLGLLLFTNMEPSYGVLPVAYWFLDRFLGYAAPALHAVAYQQFEESLLKKSTFLQERTRLRTPAALPIRPLAVYCGIYQDPLVGDVEVKGAGEALLLSFEHNPVFTAKLTHWQEDTFLIQWQDAFIPAGFLTFQCDQEGKPTSILFDQPRLLDVDFSELALKRTK